LSWNFSSAFAVMLDPGRPQAGEAMLVDGSLPVEEFIDGKGIALASLLEAQEATADSRDDLGLAADNPATGVLGR
jgi:hypothetical protein